MVEVRGRVLELDAVLLLDHGVPCEVRGGHRLAVCNTSEVAVASPAVKGGQMRLSLPSQSDIVVAPVEDVAVCRCGARIVPASSKHVGDRHFGETLGDGITADLALQLQAGTC